MKSLIVLTVLGIFANLVNSQAIVSIEVKTLDEEDAGMTLGNIDMDIYNANFDNCQIDELDGDGNDFTAGNIDAFEGAELQDCLLFVAPNSSIPLLRLQHSGLDAWGCEWVRIIFDIGTFVQCNDGGFLDNGQSHDIACDDVKLLSDEQKLQYGL